MLSAKPSTKIFCYPWKIAVLVRLQQSCLQSLTGKAKTDGQLPLRISTFHTLAEKRGALSTASLAGQDTSFIPLVIQKFWSLVNDNGDVPSQQSRSKTQLDLQSSTPTVYCISAQFNLTFQ